jgi:hypothetical protein
MRYCCAGLVFGSAPLRTAPDSARQDNGPTVGTAVGIEAAVLVAAGDGAGVSVDLGWRMGEQPNSPRMNTGTRARRRYGMNAACLNEDNAPHYTRGL